MALDGIFLSKIKAEIGLAVGSRIDKIQQPGREEIILSLRGKEKSGKLYISPSANAPRIHFVENAPEAPMTPPMFCMLLRKHLSGAILTDVRQLGTDRALFLDFLSTNEIGDRVILHLGVEIMGKSSNIILFDDEDVIIDAIRRIDFSSGKDRQILPKLKYALPPVQGKRSLLFDGADVIFESILEKRNKYLSKAVIDSIEGISPVVSREVAFLATGYDEYVSELSSEQKLRLREALCSLKEVAVSERDVYMLLDENGKPKEISFFPITQYGEKYSTKAFSSPSKLLESFYAERDRLNRVSHRGKELSKRVNSLIERTARKISNQTAELERCKNKDELRLFGELITNNIYSLKKGSVVYEVENYYDDMKRVSIPADPALSPMDNANRYYKLYRKAKTAETMLTGLIAEAEEELSYLETVSDELSRAESDLEIDNIRQELVEGGYLRKAAGKKNRAPKELKPLEFLTDDGFSVLVGRNNVQNDKLSLRQADGNDMWLHTQSFPGSHVIIKSKGGAVSDEAIEQAAAIAAYFSKARESSLVAVDYTPVKLLKKPKGAKPGKVIYHEYYTIITDPDKDLVNRLKV